jgi:predicted transposase YbfD/YdcC
MSFIAHFENLEDSRTDINKHYDLLDMVFLTMSAVLSGAKGWKAIHIFGVAQLAWLREYREFTHGIPTRHSIGRIIRGIKAESLIGCFEQWINTIRVQEEKEHIAFDGKVLRGSGNGCDLNPLQLMSAMVVDSGLILYQQEVSDKTNEIPVMQAMLRQLSVKGAIITADAMHCQTMTTEVIRAEGGDYMLQVKDNQRNLRKEIMAFFHKAYRETPQALKAGYYEEIGKAHGRIEERYYRLLPVSDWMAGMEKWQDIQSVVEVTRKRTFKKKGKEHIEEEISYYISSLGDDVKEAARAIRNHWAIENSQHWVLDVTFREDESQIYAEDGAKNMALFRRALLNLIKAHPLKDSVAGKMMRAGWDSKFRAEILFGQKMGKV